MNMTAKRRFLTALKGFDISIDLLRQQNFLRRPKHLTINLNLAQIRRRYGQKPDECKDKDGANPMWPAGISYMQCPSACYLAPFGNSCHVSYISSAAITQLCKGKQRGLLCSQQGRGESGVVSTAQWHLLNLSLFLCGQKQKINFCLW